MVWCNTGVTVIQLTELYGGMEVVDVFPELLPANKAMVYS